MHGAPLDEETLKALKQKFGFNPEESFVIPDKVRTYLYDNG